MGPVDHDHGVEAAIQSNFGKRANGKTGLAPEVSLTNDLGASENGRVAIRHVRRDAMDQLRKEKSAGKIPEDDEKHGEKELQKLHDTYIARIDTHLAHKDKEIMTV